MNAGSFFLAEISRITSSFSPGGTVSDSISVMKPWRYSPRTSFSTFWGSVATWIPLLCIAALQAGERYPHFHGWHYRRRRARKLGQGHGFQGIANGETDALPVVAHAAHRLDAATVMAQTALGNGHRSLDGVNDLHGGNQFRRAVLRGWRLRGRWRFARRWGSGPSGPAPPCRN